MNKSRSPSIALATALLLIFLNLVGGAQAATGKSDKGPEIKKEEASQPPAPAPSDPGVQHPAVPGGTTCPTTAPVKLYDVSAIDVEITLNRWGEWDPLGKMYVLTDQIPAVRAAEARNRRARQTGEPGPEQGLLDDPIQPLTMRANVGDCVEIRFTNQLTEPASMHIQGAAQILKGSGEPATASNEDAIAKPGVTVLYQWYIDPSAHREGTRQIRPAGSMRRLNDHGLFGALIVEPAGSRYLHNKTAQDLCRDLGPGVKTCQSDWRAIVDPGAGPDFREHVVYYHEVGDDEYQPLDRNGNKLPIVAPLTGSYGPGRFALNYRSEPHETRLGAQQALTGGADESMGYSSYFFGDPAVPILRGYLGDPTKIRLVHGSGETFHVHHLHGGGIRWPRQPEVADADAAFDAGLRKEFDGFPASMTLDSQTLGPSEAFDTVPYCGAGGCQQGPGDYVFHCHVGHHYVSGMWSFWRVYNTLRTEGMPDPSDHLGALAELPDRAGRIAQAVSSDGLIGRTVAVGNTPVTVTAENLAEVVERLLPPQGVPTGYDASVLDWVRQGNTYLNEPNDTQSWANHTPVAPGQRPPIEFDPLTGKLAYPFLRPHFLKRPPFAPGHGPAAFFDPSNAAELPEPGANGADSLCPTGTPRRFFDIIAEPAPLQVTPSNSIDGLLFMLRQDRSGILAGQKKKEPLVIRGNQGDCVDLTFVNGIPDEQLEGFSKVNLHQHFVQFDIQSADGVVVGLNYETSLRSFKDTGKAIQAAAAAGATTVTVADTTGLHPGTLVVVGIDQDLTQEIAGIERIDGRVLTLAQPLRHDHAAGELVSPEFVRQRWFLDMQFGTVYWHDHVKGLLTWPRGLVGAIVVEPRGSTYHDPQTGAEIRSGTLADIRTSSYLTPYMAGSFREAVALLMDTVEGSDAAINMRSEPLEHRMTPLLGVSPALAFSSVVFGDPFTMLPRAYVGDPVVFRVLTVSAQRLNAFRLTGHTFSIEPYKLEIDFRNVLPVGISERETAHVTAGGPVGKPGDFLYSMGDHSQVVKGGAWGIFRVHDSVQPDLQPLPDQPLPRAGPGFPYLAPGGGAPPRAADPGNPCPAGAPERTFSVSAIQMDIALNRYGDKLGKGSLYVLDSDVENVRKGRKAPEPLAIRANEGDCVVIRFTNRLEEEPASMHIDKLVADPNSLGITVGYNADQTVAPGQSITYRLYANHEVGVALIRDYGNVFKNPERGLYGALIIEPRGSTYLHPTTGQPLASGVEAIISSPNEPDFREFAVFMHDSDPSIGLHVMPYHSTVKGPVAINYRSEPLAARQKSSKQPDPSTLFSASTLGAPNTPMFRAEAGDPVRIRLLHGYGEQSQVFALEGHHWAMTPRLPGSLQVYATRIGTQEALDLALVGGAGGPQAVPGDYLYLNQRLAFMEAGQWGLMRVYVPGTSNLFKLPDR